MSNYLGYVYTGLCTDAPLPSEKKTGERLSPRFFVRGGGLCTQATFTRIDKEGTAKSFYSSPLATN